MKALLVATLAVALALPAAAIADRGSSDRSRTTLESAKKHSRAKAKVRRAKRLSIRVSRPAATVAEREVKGRIASLAPLTVGSLTCVVPSGVALSAFRVGDVVELTCDLVHGQWLLRKLKLEDRDGDDDDNSGPGSDDDSGSDDDDDDDSGSGSDSESDDD